MSYSAVTYTLIAFGTIGVHGCSSDGLSFDARVLDLQASDAGDGKQQFTLRFVGRVGEEQSQCGQTYSRLGRRGNDIELLDFRFYVSNVRFLERNREVSATLVSDGKWQSEHAALVDLEDGTGGCRSTGTAEMNDSVVVRAPLGKDYNGVIFDVAVPFSANHSALSVADPPLDVSAMHWVWSTGRKFFRVDVRVDDAMSWNVHIGSTRCTSNGPTDPPDEECDRPNRPRVTLFDYRPASPRPILVDLEPLFSDSNIESDTPSTPDGCQSRPSDVNECMLLFPNLGLDFTTGECQNNCIDQSVFRLDVTP